MRYRQIHLDFHTSERIPGIGARFDAKKFAKTFADANVDSVTVFSKCHHGVSYHPTKVGQQHPHPTSISCAPRSTRCTRSASMHRST